MIKNNLIIIIFIAFSSFQSIASAGFEEALEAHARGDEQAAFEGFRTAAESGDVRAFGKLAGLYLYGVGTQKDYKKAYVWFGLADASGDQYGGRFQGAASSMLNPEELPALLQEIEEYKKDFGLDLDESRQ